MAAASLNVRERMREVEKARRFWNGLDRRQRDELGDAFVLGTFDWREWFDAKPSGALLREVDELRILWEMEGGA